MKNSFLISLIVFIVFMTFSCKTEYIPVESVRYDSIFIEKIKKDSTFVKDSVYIHHKGDTVFKDKFVVVYKEKILRDTMLTIRKDSIPIPYPVERKRTWWEQTKIDIASVATMLVTLFILYRLIRWFIKRTRKE